MASGENQELISDCRFNPLGLGDVVTLELSALHEQPLYISLDSTAEGFIIWLTGDIKVPSFSKGTLATLIAGLFYISNFHT